jgi:hypothetical protein
MSYRGQASSAKMMSLGKLTYLSINIGLALIATIKKQAPFMNTRNIFMDFKFNLEKID